MARLSTRAFVLRLIFQIESFPRHEGKLRNRGGGEEGRKILQINATGPEHRFQCQTLITIFHLASDIILLSSLLLVPLVGLFLKKRYFIDFFFLFLIDFQKMITSDRNPLSRSNLKRYLNDRFFFFYIIDSFQG